MSQGPDREREWPDRLYKYMSLENERKQEHARVIIDDEAIHFSAPCDFNDPFDCQFIREFDPTPEEEKRTFLECLEWQRGSREEAERELAEILGPGGTERRQRLREEIRQNGETVTERTRVFCLTEVRDDILMWSHYANCHRGICLEFGFCKDVRVHDGFAARTWRVDYGTDFPVVNPYKTLEGERIRKMVCRKSCHWGYEKEWRVIYAHPPGETGDHEERLPPALLEGVIMGARISKSSRQLVLALARNRPRPLRPLKVYQARLKQREYGLDIVRIEDGPNS